MLLIHWRNSDVINKEEEGGKKGEGKKCNPKTLPRHEARNGSRSLKKIKKREKGEEKWSQNPPQTQGEKCFILTAWQNTLKRGKREKSNIIILHSPKTRGQKGFIPTHKIHQTGEKRKKVTSKTLSRHEAGNASYPLTKYIKKRKKGKKNLTQNHFTFCQDTRPETLHTHWQNAPQKMEREKTNPRTLPRHKTRHVSYSLTKQIKKREEGKKNLSSLHLFPRVTPLRVRCSLVTSCPGPFIPHSVVRSRRNDVPGQRRSSDGSFAWDLYILKEFGPRQRREGLKGRT